MTHFSALPTTIGSQLDVSIQVKRIDSSWGSRNNQNGKYTLIDTATQPLLIPSFLKLGYRAPLIIHVIKVGV